MDSKYKDIATVSIGSQPFPNQLHYAKNIANEEDKES